MRKVFLERCLSLTESQEFSLTKLNSFLGELWVILFFMGFLLSSRPKRKLLTSKMSEGMNVRETTRTGSTRQRRRHLLSHRLMVIVWLVRWSSFSYGSSQSLLSLCVSYLVNFEHFCLNLSIDSNLGVPFMSSWLKTIFISVCSTTFSFFTLFRKCAHFHFADAFVFLFLRPFLLLQFFLWWKRREKKMRPTKEKKKKPKNQIRGPRRTRFKEQLERGGNWTKPHLIIFRTETTACIRQRLGCKKKICETNFWESEEEETTTASRHIVSLQVIHFCF